MKLYKYIKALPYNEPKVNGHLINTKLFDALVNSRIFFSHPASFNDPFECVIPIKIDNYEKNSSAYLEFIKELLKERIGEDTSIRMKRINEVINFGMPLENCLVACLSTRKNNSLMWSHYGDQYRGICLCYEFPDNKEKFDNNISWSPEVLSLKKNGLEYYTNSVKYIKKRPSLEIENTSLQIKQWKFRNDCEINNIVFTKPNFWSYEHEWRIALILPFNCNRGFASGIDTSDYYMTIPKKWLKQITFGFRLENQYCQDIINILNENGYKNVSINKIETNHDTFELSTLPYIATIKKRN